MSRSRSSPRKFSEKIALLNKREADTTAEFEKIIQEVEATTRAPPSPRYQSSTPTNSFSWIEDTSNSYIENPVTYYEGYQTSNENQHHQQDQQHHHAQFPIQNQVYEQQATSPHIGLVPNIEISHTDDDNSYYHHQQQVNGDIATNDRSSSMSAARSLPDIANLRVNSPNDCLSSSYSDQRLRSNTISNNYDICYETEQSNELSQDPDYFSSQMHQQQQQPQQQQAELCFQQQQPVVIMDNHPSPGTYNEYYHPPQQQQQPTSMVRANSTNAVMGSWSNNNTLYTPKMNNMFSRSSDDCCGNLDNPDLDAFM